ncbi:proline dehydrogenase [Cryptotrichosporon argae]
MSRARPLSAILRRRAPFVLAGAALVGYTAAPSTSSTLEPPSSSLSSLSTQALLRSYLVYTLCTLPSLIDHSPALLHALTHSPVPGLRALTEAGVRHTFFAQFVAGETAAECVGVMRALRTRGVGGVLNYSAEADEHAAVKDWDSEARQRLEEVERAIEALGAYEDEVARDGGARGSSMFALKITGLVDPAVLQRASTTLLRLRPLTSSNAPSSPAAASTVLYPGAPSDADARVLIPDAKWGTLLALTGSVEGSVLVNEEGVRQEDERELKILWERVRGLAERARDRGVKLMVDAEHTEYQPALDAFTLLLSAEFNRPQRGTTWSGPVIIGTYQAYLTRQPQLLDYALKHAEKNSYALGVKLVRGAYVVSERERWAREGRAGADPIWPNKPATDECYNASLRLLISTMKAQLQSRRPELALSLVFGTHNADSVDLVIERLEAEQLATRTAGEGAAAGRLRLKDEVKGKVSVAQLYGMRDDLSDKIVDAFEPSNMPIALKYIAYGKLAEVIPFLGRRAIENKSVMSGQGGAAFERGRVGAELWRRVVG